MKKVNWTFNVEKFLVGHFDFVTTRGERTTKEVKETKWVRVSDTKSVFVCEWEREMEWKRGREVVCVFVCGVWCVSNSEREWVRDRESVWVWEREREWVSEWVCVWVSEKERERVRKSERERESEWVSEWERVSESVIYKMLHNGRSVRDWL